MSMEISSNYKDYNRCVEKHTAGAHEWDSEYRH